MSASPCPPLPAVYDRLSPTDRRIVREEYVRRQSGKCCLCKGDLALPPSEFVQTVWVDESLFPPGFFRHRVHLHHSHRTGKTLGAVHCRCNAVAFQHFGQ
jgi:hypothetical protein